MRQEFFVHVLSDAGNAKAIEAGEILSEALEKLEALVPNGRERALVTTKLQEAGFFAKRGIALDPKNQAAF